MIDVYRAGRRWGCRPSVQRVVLVFEEAGQNARLHAGARDVHVQGAVGDLAVDVVGVHASVTL